MRNLLTLALIVALSFAHAQNKDVTLLGQLSYNSGINDVWGWADTANNKEYALVGVQNGLSVVDVTNASNPQQVQFFQGASSIWRDMKTWDHYAYTVHDSYSGTSSGIFIVDMNTITSQFPSKTNFFPQVSLAGTTTTFNRAHNIYIDENGVLYLFGSNIGNGGALMFDLATDPMNPTYLGVFDQVYLHDGVARGDTLWGAAINQGYFNVVDVSSKSNPSVWSTQTTPLNFCHNIWFSDDNKRVFTTDERSGAYIGEYDVSDLSNITKLSQLRTSFGNDVIPHNAHFHNNFLVNSYYTAGLQILDVSVPGIMLETAYYDTSPFSGNGFTGAWGAYPYLPSGNILVSDREQGLFVLSSTYPRGSYFQARVVDSLSQNTLAGASVDFLSGSISGQTDITGLFRDGQVQNGSFSVEVKKAGYFDKTIQVQMQAGLMLDTVVELVPLNFSVNEFSSLNGIELFPNPATGQVTLTNIKAGIDKLSFSLIDITGAVKNSGELSVNSGQVNLSILEAPGYYVLQLIYENEAPVNLKLSIR